MVFEHGTLGLAYTGGMCDSFNSVALIQDNTLYAILTAGTMTHEMGHNLGMDHDRNFCTCNKRPCIMNPYDSFDPPHEFTSCNLWDYQYYLTAQDAQCILNDPLSTDIVTTTVCGNGFVEAGEDCDCGDPEQCENECCDAATCKLNPGAKCAEGACCEKCQFKKAGEVCRATKDDCDLPEHCTGQTAECPIDHFHKNGHPCRNNLGYCIKGICPTLADQCIALFGPDAKVAPDECFENNQKGDDINYCKKQNETKIPCEPQDVKCGRLYCTVDSTDENSCKYHFSKGNPNNGMVYIGTKCAEGKVCDFEKCDDLETVFGPTM
ncbi:PREDICTED: zinc metalloproteinase-disintegrin-like NaMP [Thamnophis sirtalis]|uniref:Zinc metalloproteinase-disintegrin-like NaMP n=1 Tax=Thamnophis sirtalis TaxID=35019 RepID=A0A6I9Z3Y9_9SAUR|nr:PREDICTED: zinc metalloproteinase-disintegrin-like NaMP [Thamnophis sirtalis]